MSHKNCPKRLKNRIFSLIIFTFVLTFLFTFLLSDISYAQTSDQISLQGKIVRNDTGYEGLNVVEGTPTCVASGADTCDFQVKYYSASTSGTLYLTETFSDIEIGDYGGVFNLKLGSGSATTTAECSDGTCNTIEEVFGEFKTIYLEIGFAPGGAGSFTEIFTRTSLNASAFAMGAGSDSFSFYNTDNTGESSLNAVAGAVYYNTTDDELKLYNGSSWVSLATGSSSLWTEQDVGVDYSTYMSASGLGIFDDFTLDLDDDRLSVHTAQMEGGFSVYSSYDLTGGTWPLVSFKADHSNYASTILELTQDGTGDILTGYTGSTLSFEIDNLGDIHLASNGIEYFEPFASLPLSTDLSPNTGEGCLYSYGGNLYWDSDCSASSPIDLGGGATLWTDGGTFTYLTSITDDLVLGASTAASSKFFFDVSEGRLGIGTDSPQAAIDIAGASSSISNTSGDITIDATDQLVLLSDVELGNGSTTRSLYAYNAARTYYGQLELYNLATGNMTLNTTFESGNIILSPGTSGGIGIGTTTPSALLEVLGASSNIQSSVSNINTSGIEPGLVITKTLTSGTAGDGIGSSILFQTESGNTSFPGIKNTAQIMSIISWQGDASNGPKGDLVFQTGWNGSLTDKMRLDADGNLGIGTASPGAKLDVQGTADSVQLSVKGYSTQTNNILEVKKSDASSILTLSNTGLLTLSGNFLGGTNNSYDIGTTSTRWKDVYTQGNIQIGANGDSGSIRYNTTNNELEFSNDGSTWIPLADAIKTTTLSAEYPGAVLAADGSANVGFMTSDAEGSASNSMNYYEWNSSESTLQDYDVRLRFTIPHDFSSWGTNAFTLNLATEAAASINNKVDIYVYEESSGTVDDSSVAQYSSTAGVWQTTTIQGADLGDCNAAGETCLILIRMYSANDNYVRVGDIDVNYNRKL
jgi:hypothetical protein